MIDKPPVSGILFYMKNCAEYIKKARIEYFDSLKVKNLDGEVWKNVNGYRYYMISNKGRFKSLDRNVFRISDGKFIRFAPSRLIKARKDRHGYYYVVLRNDFNYDKKSFRIHRLVADAFIPNVENKLVVNHIDGVRDNNVVENLEWVTHQENLIHAFRVLRVPHNGHKSRYGKENYNCKGVRCIDKETGEILIFETLHECAKYFQIHWTTVWCNIHNKKRKSKRVDKTHILMYNN